MPENVSADGLRRGPRVRPIARAADFSGGQKLLLLSLNALPLIHLSGSAAILVWPLFSIIARVAIALAAFLLLPPIAARLVLMRPLPRGQVPVPSLNFFRWWTVWQLQGVFNRLPWIEEGLRFLPGIYSLWLRLWGAKIGRLTLWSPGVRVYDRPLLRLGNDVVIGLEVRMSGHFGGLDDAGISCLTLGEITVGDRCTVGAGAFLGPGLRLDSDQFTEVLFLGTPFAHWRAGARAAPHEFTPTSS